ncbi:nuclear transport factor 2 family protein [Novosphingobium sp. M1R2S20]|uniref:Nuclear transport factor 2 family protein n=1 Tax=Novosphingobium rhizovicinum TaxID=3228928 RepID=A0ABV3R708_9SPHN
MSAEHALADALADEFFGALEDGSVQGVLRCFAPDAIIWHNFDGVRLSPSDNVPGLEALFLNFVRREYRDVRRQPTPSGFVQQHILRLETKEGQVIDWPACIVFEIDGGKIVRLDEYVDLGQLRTEG